MISRHEKHGPCLNGWLSTTHLKIISSINWGSKGGSIEKVYISQGYSENVYSQEWKKNIRGQCKLIFRWWKISTTSTTTQIYPIRSHIHINLDYIYHIFKPQIIQWFHLSAPSNSDKAAGGNSRLSPGQSLGSSTNPEPKVMEVWLEDHQMSHEKNPLSFCYSGWLIGILISWFIITPI